MLSPRKRRVLALLSDWKFLLVGEGFACRNLLVASRDRVRINRIFMVASGFYWRVGIIDHLAQSLEDAKIQGEVFL